MKVIINLKKWIYLDKLFDISDRLYIGKFLGIKDCKHLNNFHLRFFKRMFRKDFRKRYSFAIDCEFIEHFSIYSLTLFKKEYDGDYCFPLYKIIWNLLTKKDWKLEWYKSA